MDANSLQTVFAALNLGAFTPVFVAVGLWIAFVVYGLIALRQIGRASCRERV